MPGDTPAPGNPAGPLSGPAGALDPLQQQRRRDLPGAALPGQSAAVPLPGGAPATQPAAPAMPSLNPQSPFGVPPPGIGGAPSPHPAAAPGATAPLPGAAP